MAKKFSIKRDPTFTTTVNLPAPGQAPVPVSFTFKWMDRESLAKFHDERKAFAEAFFEKAKAGAANAEIAKMAVDFEVPQLKSIIVGWDIEEEFNDENLRALVESGSELPGAIVNGYLEAYHAAREGN